MLSELLPEEKRKLHELEQKISEAEYGNSRYTYSDLSFEYEQLMNRVSGLDKLLSKEPRSKIDDYRRRLAHLKSSAQHVKLSLDNIGKKHSYHSNIARQRAELFGGAQGKGEDITLEMAENGSLSRSSQMINEYISLGRESLGELSSQRERLKAIQRRVLDIFNYLGLSNTLMKTLENRDNVDKWIVYGGMLFIIILLVVVYMYFRK